VTTVVSSLAAWTVVVSSWFNDATYASSSSVATWAII
jgi:hypothetical protein